MTIHAQKYIGMIAVKLVRFKQTYWWLSMKIGDLVTLDPRINGGVNSVGFVMRIDLQHYGSNTAYKISHVERGVCVRSGMVDFIGETADGIRDRVLVLWSNEVGYEYCESTDLEVISESR